MSHVGQGSSLYRWIATSRQMQVASRGNGQSHRTWRHSKSRGWVQKSKWVFESGRRRGREMSVCLGGDLLSALQEEVAFFALEKSDF